MPQKQYRASFRDVNVDVSQAYQPKNKSYFEKIEEIVKSRNGTMLSNGCFGPADYIRIRCSAGHEWSTLCHVVESGHWCHKCSRKRLTIEDMDNLAAGNGGKCLSRTYIDNKTKLQWECGKGHMWWSTAINVRNQGTWCPVCGSNKLTEEQLLDELDRMEMETGSRPKKNRWTSMENIVQPRTATISVRGLMR